MYSPKNNGKKNLFSQGNDSQLELFRIQTSAEVAKKLAKKQKKARKKAKEAGGEEDAGDVTTDDPTLEISDEIMKMTAVKMSGKIRAFDCFQEQTDQIKVNLYVRDNGNIKKGVIRKN